MEILIIGAGAMGGLFAALLSSRARVCLYTTNSEHFTILSRQGLSIQTRSGEQQQIQVEVLADLRQYRRQADLILICTKATATAVAAQQAAGVLAPEGIMLSLQNGVGNVEHLQAAVGKQRAMAGVTAQAATLLAAGMIRHAGCGPTTLGAEANQMPQAQAIAALFNGVGIATSVVAEVQQLLWSKLLVNVGINALTALLRVPNGVLIDVKTCDALLVQAVEEAVHVASALGLAFDCQQQVAQVREVCRLTAGNHSSMLQDILRGRETEIKVINGAVVNRGEEVGIVTPVNRLITQLILALEDSADRRL